MSIEALEALAMRFANGEVELSDYEKMRSVLLDKVDSNPSFSPKNSAGAGTNEAVITLPAIGDIIDDRYKVLERAGEGGMGVVYKALDLVESTNDKPYYLAIKFLNPTLQSDALQRERFRREASASRALRHTNIIGMYLYGQSEIWFYIIMEWLEGKSIKQIQTENLQKNGDESLSWSLVKQWLPYIGAGLGFAHQQGVIHRDIKPANIFIEPDGRVVVLDFGIAKVMKDTLTKTGLSVNQTSGSIEYMAPESVIRGNKAQPQVDIYSLAVTIYELLVGETPFIAEVCYARTSKHPMPAKPEVLSEREWDVLKQGLDVDPAKRMPSYWQPEKRSFALQNWVQALLGKEHIDIDKIDTAYLPPQPVGTVNEPSEKITSKTREGEVFDKDFSQEDQHFAEVSKRRDSVALRRFLKVYPNTVYEKEINTLLDEIDKNDKYEKLMKKTYLSVVKEKNELDLKKFLNDFPDSAYFGEVQSLHNAVVAERKKEELEAEKIKIKNIYFKAKEERDAERLEQLLQEFPNNDFVNDIKKSISLISEEREEAAFKKVKLLNERSAFESFLTKYPGGRFSNVIEECIASLERRDLLHNRVVDGKDKEFLEKLREAQANALKISSDVKGILHQSAVQPTMVLVPGGRFTMGSSVDEQGRKVSESVKENVLVKPFYCGVYAVTYREWREYSNSRNDILKKEIDTIDDDKPVVGASFLEVKAFLEWLNSKTVGDFQFRLLTEAEWEYACRAGSITPFNTGKDISWLSANFNASIRDNYCEKGKFRGGSVAVDTFAPNNFGLYQMHGNVCEWTSDEWNPTRRDNEVDYRIYRGGSWASKATRLRSANRGYAQADESYDYIGFRLAADIV